jgi:DNA-binding PadR family transcriptional regulator
VTSTPSDREFQLLAVLAPGEQSQTDGPELSGRQIAKTHEEETHEAVSYGRVHTFLHAMEERGWVRSREDHHDGRHTRLYRLDPRGLEAVSRWRRDSAPPGAEPRDEPLAESAAQQADRQQKAMQPFKTDSH